MTSSKNMLVFTDLDGTLIDHDTYEWKAAAEALVELKTLNIPIIPCTSKTRAEIEFYRKKIGLVDPFISENGGAIFIPKGYFKKPKGAKASGDYLVLELGMGYAGLRSAVKGLRKYGKLTGFGDMTVEEVAADTGLTLEQAEMAKQREYDEAFKFEGDEEGLKKAIEKKGLNWTKGGRYWHIMGDNDKGKALDKLADLFKTGNRKPKTVGLGDSLNDLPMLKAVDVPILVQKKDGTYDPRVEVKGLTKAQKPGPEGWNEEVLKLIK